MKAILQTLDGLAVSIEVGDGQRPLKIMRTLKERGKFLRENSIENKKPLYRVYQFYKEENGTFIYKEQENDDAN